MGAIKEVCGQRGWSLWRPMCEAITYTLLVQAEVPPERVMNDFKAYASRRLNRRRLDEPDRKRWQHTISVENLNTSGRRFSTS
jgi:hypothetical protein